MTRLEKLGFDLTTEEGLTKLLDVCPRESKNYYCCPMGPDGNVSGCPECVAKFLLSEVPTKKVKRYETYNGDFVKAFNDFRNKDCLSGQLCNKCRFEKSATEIGECFALWLMEDIEVVEECD